MLKQDSKANLQVYPNETLQEFDPCCHHGLKSFYVEGELRLLDNGTDFGIDINNTHAFLLLWSTLKGLTIWSPSASSDETISEALLSVMCQN